MSHMVEMEVALPSLDLLGKAATACGMELVKGQKTHRWYGRWVGDYPMPAGFTKEDLGKCDHAIRVKGANAQTYEVGVVRRRDGRGWTLMYDFWQGGHGLEAKAGKNCQHLLQNYGLEAIKKSFVSKGYKLGPVKMVDGKLCGKMVA